MEDKTNLNAGGDQPAGTAATDTAATDTATAPPATRERAQPVDLSKPMTEQEFNQMRSRLAETGQVARVEVRPPAPPQKTFAEWAAQSALPRGSGAVLSGAALVLADHIVPFDQVVNDGRPPNKIFELDPIYFRERTREQLELEFLGADDLAIIEAGLKAHGAQIGDRAPEKPPTLVVDSVEAVPLGSPLVSFAGQLETVDTSAQSGQAADGTAGASGAAQDGAQQSDQVNQPGQDQNAATGFLSSVQPRTVKEGEQLEAAAPPPGSTATEVTGGGPVTHPQGAEVKTDSKEGGRVKK